MAVKVKLNREFVTPINWADGEEAGEMLATWAMPTKAEYDKHYNAPKRLLELFLVSVEGLQVLDAGDAVVAEGKEAVLLDGQLIKVFFDAFEEHWGNATLPSTWKKALDVITTSAATSNTDQASGTEA